MIVTARRRSALDAPGGTGAAAAAAVTAAAAAVTVEVAVVAPAVAPVGGSCSNDEQAVVGTGWLRFRHAPGCYVRVCVGARVDGGGTAVVTALLTLSSSTPWAI